MAAQSLLAKLGCRAGIVGSSVALAIAAPLATGNYDPTCHTDAARTGWFFDRTATAETVNAVVGGVNGILINHVNTNSVTLTLFSPNPIFRQGDGTGTPSATLNGSVTTRNIKIKTAGLNRTTMACSSTAESGTDAGSSWIISLQHDDGTNGSTALQIARTLLNASASIFPTITTQRGVAITAGTFTTNITLFSMTAGWNFAASSFRAISTNMTDTASDANSLLLNVQLSNISRVKIRKDGYWECNSVDDLTGSQINFSRAFTLTGNLTDPFQINFTTALAGAFTVTRYSWIELDNPTDAATVTDAAVFMFDANAGTHICIDAATTKTTPATVNAWDKYDVNGTIYYSPCYTSKTT